MVDVFNVLVDYFFGRILVKENIDIVVVYRKNLYEELFEEV